MININRIRRSDLPELAVLFSELTGNERSRVNLEKNYVHVEQNDDYIILGASVDGKLAGSLMGIICLDFVDECRPFMLIENVIVSEKFRGQGIGRLLMKNIEDLAIERDCSYIIFVSGSKREGAHRFYESIGYDPGEAKGFKKILK
ncbi:MAG: N-acetyltransferase [Spirochaetae bacterium HGW-Spirochaetae-5]|nr:MAG: N-acetyltransferase [Spirochaetae bacterium HGW-Spirochaetae-5]